MKSTFESRLSTRVRFSYAIAVAMWTASLFLPAAQLNGSMRLIGYRVFMIGIDAISAGMPGWFANPCLVAAIIAGIMHRWLLATVLSGIACMFTLTSFYAPALARANGLPIEDVVFEVGFFLWLAASSLIFATSACAWLVVRRRST